MRAAWYNANVDESKILKTGDFSDCEPETGEVQIEICYSGLHTENLFGSLPNKSSGKQDVTIIPGSDGAGIIRKAGKGVPASWLGKRVLCFGVRLFRPYGTAAEFCCVPLNLVVELGKKTPMMQAAQMGLPATLGFMAIRKLNYAKAKTLLVHNGATDVAQYAIQFGKRAGAHVIATVSCREEVITAIKAGATEVFMLTPKVGTIIRERYPDGVDYIIEASIRDYLRSDLALLKVGGSIVTYLNGDQFPEISLGELLSTSVTLHFLNVENFSIDEKKAALKEAICAIDEGWPGLEIKEIYKLGDIAKINEFFKRKCAGKRLLIALKDE